METCHHLLILILFQTSTTDFLPGKTKAEILKNVAVALFQVITVTLYSKVHQLTTLVNMN